MTEFPEEPRAWDFRETCLTIVDGLSWEEWEGVWTSARQMHRSASFWIGDALVYAQKTFPEQWAQVLDKHAVDIYRGAMWVCREIPVNRRRPDLSFSHHKIVAGIEGEAEQDRWLDLAVVNDWTTRELGEEIKKAKEAAAAYPSNGTPPAEGAPRSARNAPEEDDSRAPEGTATEAQERRNRPDAPIPLQTAFPHTTRDGPVAVEAIRSVIAQLRAVAPDLADGLVDSPEMASVEDAVLGLMGRRPGSRSILQDEVAARALVPAGWRQRYEDDGMQMMWTVELRRGDQMGVAIGPHLPSTLIEAVLAAMISDLGGE